MRNIGKYIKKLFTNRRGSTYELAIIMLIVIFGLCTILTTAALIQKTDETNMKKKMLSDVKVEQIGEDFLASPGSYTHENATNIQETKDGIVYHTLTLSDESGNVLLTLTVTDDGRIIRRNVAYNPPHNTQNTKE